MKTQKLIEKLIPYVSENFITYPLFEEGDYRPTISIWSITNIQHDFKTIFETKLLHDKYEISHEGFEHDNIDTINLIKSEFPNIDLPTNMVTYHHTFYINNKFDILDDSSYCLDDMLKYTIELVEYLQTLKDNFKDI